MEREDKIKQMAARIADAVGFYVRAREGRDPCSPFTCGTEEHAEMQAAIEEAIRFAASGGRT